MMNTETKKELIEKIVDLEWEMFQATHNIGGRADCQDDFGTFSIMRTCQALAWSEEMCRLWLADLEAAKDAGRNLVAEKYARMMRYTSPDEYEALKGLLPEVAEDAENAAEVLSGMMADWAEEAAALYPNFLGLGRPVRSALDSREVTSLETYLRGEFLTMSEDTLRAFLIFYYEMSEKGINLYVETQKHTVEALGYPSLGGAEEAAKRFKENKGI